MTVGRWLLLLGFACLVIVVFTHVAETLHLFPGMGSKLGGRAPARLSSNRHTAVRPGVCLSIALVPSNFCAALRGRI